MTGVVDICNLALSAVGTRSTISSLTEGTPEAVACAQWYDTTRQQIIRMARWGCMRAFTNLALLKAAPGTPENPQGSQTGAWSPVNPPPPWLYSYAYPADCLMALYIVPQPTMAVAGTPIFSAGQLIPGNQTFGPPVKSIIATDVDSNGNRIKTICTNQQQATLCYSTDVLDPNEWDQGFEQSMIYGLAGAVAQALTGDTNLAVKLYKLANETIAQARVMNANENMQQQDIIPDFIRIRGVTYGWDGYTYMLDQFGPMYPVSI